MTTQPSLPLPGLPPQHCPYQPHHRRINDPDFGMVFEYRCTLPFGHEGDHLCAWRDITHRCETVRTELV